MGTPKGGADAPLSAIGEACLRRDMTAIHEVLEKLHRRSLFPYNLEVLLTRGRPDHPVHQVPRQTEKSCVGIDLVTSMLIYAAEVSLLFQFLPVFFPMWELLILHHPHICGIELNFRAWKAPKTNKSAILVDAIRMVTHLRDLSWRADEQGLRNAFFSFGEVTEGVWTGW